jgi:hypothetical protein
MEDYVIALNEEVSKIICKRVKNIDFYLPDLFRVHFEHSRAFIDFVSPIRITGIFPEVIFPGPQSKDKIKSVAGECVNSFFEVNGEIGLSFKNGVTFIVDENLRGTDEGIIVSAGGWGLAVF